MQKLTKSRDLDMSGPAKASPGGQVLVSKADFYLFFLKITPCFYHFSMKSHVLLNKLRLFKKSICCIQQIYDFVRKPNVLLSKRRQVLTA